MSRRLLISTVVIVVITILVVVVKTHTSDQSELINKNLLTPKAVATIDKVSITNFDKSITLDKKSNFWVVEGTKDNPAFVIDSLKLFKFLSQVTETKLAYVASVEKKDWDSLRLYKQGDSQSTQQNTGTYINLSSKGKPTLVFVLGNELETGNPPHSIGGNYIRLVKSKDDSTAYAVKTSFYVSANEDDWIKKTLLPSDIKDKLQSVNIAIGKTQYNISRDTKKDNFTLNLNSKKWQPSQAKVDALANSFYGLTMVDRIPLATLPKKAKQLRVIDLVLFDSKKISIQLFYIRSKKKDTYYATFLVDGKLDQVDLKQLQFVSQSWAFEIPEATAKQWLSTKISLLEKKTPTK